MSSLNIILYHLLLSYSPVIILACEKNHKSQKATKRYHNQQEPISDHLGARTVPGRLTGLASTWLLTWRTDSGTCGRLGGVRGARMGAEGGGEVAVGGGEGRVRGIVGETSGDLLAHRHLRGPGKERASIR